MPKSKGDLQWYNSLSILLIIAVDSTKKLIPLKNGLDAALHDMTFVDKVTVNCYSTDFRM